MRLTSQFRRGERGGILWTRGLVKDRSGREERDMDTAWITESEREEEDVDKALTTGRERERGRGDSLWTQPWTTGSEREEEDTTWITGSERKEEGVTTCGRNGSLGRMKRALR